MSGTQSALRDVSQCHHSQSRDGSEGRQAGRPLQRRGGQWKQHQQKRDTLRFVILATPDF